MTSTGKRIKAARDAKKMSRSTLAEKLGITRMTVWRVEAGETQIPADDLRVWAKALRVPVTELVA